MDDKLTSRKIKLEIKRKIKIIIREISKHHLQKSGKTSVAMNLAAYWQHREHNCRQLVISVFARITKQILFRSDSLASINVVFVESVGNKQNPLNVVFSVNAFNRMRSPLR